MTASLLQTARCVALLHDSLGQLRVYVVQGLTALDYAIRNGHMLVARSILDQDSYFDKVSQLCAWHVCNYSMWQPQFLISCVAIVEAWSLSSATHMRNDGHQRSSHISHHGFLLA